MARFALVSDFDGTITDTDFFSLLLERHIPRDAPDFLEEWRQRKRSHFEAMQGYFDYAPSDAAVLDELLLDTGVDPGANDAISRLSDAGWDVIVVSAGCSWYIERILNGARVSIHASPGAIEPGGGLKMRLPEESPFFSPSHGIDKGAVMRDALARYDRVAFAGDGPPDLEPALLAQPEVRFARRWLAGELQNRREPYHKFTRWSEIADRLLR